MTGRLEGRVALITGASRGIGAAAAKAIALEGAHVILIGRAQSSLERVDDAIQQAGGKPATLVPMDVRDFGKIDELGGILAQRFGKLDIFVGNAGVLGALSPVAMSKHTMWQEVMEVNFMANYRFIRSFDALFRASDAARVMFVTSSAAERTTPYWGAYAASKAALETMALTYAAEVEKTSIRVNLVNPGGVRTLMRKEAFPGEDPNTLPTPEEVTDVFVNLALPDAPHGQILRARAMA